MFTKSYLEGKHCIRESEREREREREWEREELPLKRQVSAPVNGCFKAISGGCTNMSTYQISELISVVVVDMMHSEEYRS